MLSDTCAVKNTASKGLGIARKDGVTMRNITQAGPQQAAMSEWTVAMLRTKCCSQNRWHANMLHEIRLIATKIHHHLLNCQFSQRSTAIQMLLLLPQFSANHCLWTNVGAFKWIINYTGMNHQDRRKHQGESDSLRSIQCQAEKSRISQWQVWCQLTFAYVLDCGETTCYEPETF